MIGKRVFIYVQHLLGIGHLKRAAVLARALAAQGLDVTLASGGFAVPGLGVEGARFVQLPPAGAADMSFKSLVDEHGAAVDEDWRRRRRAALLAAWHAAEPQVLVIELFPFGRRQMRFELLPLLEAAIAATRRPAIVCSVRDVLGGGRRTRAREDETLELVERYFDQVLVHGDPDFIAFDRSFGHAARLAGRLRYTGYMLDASPRSGSGGDAGRDEVIVSAGGGAVGSRLLEAAIRARPLGSLARRTWRVLAGVNVADSDFESLRTLASRAGDGRVIVERARPDFTTLLANCALSVSQAGYNTVVEILHAGTRAVVVPFAGGNETEQRLRARLLAERGLLEALDEQALTPQALAAAVDRAARRPRSAAGAIDLGGAQRSAALIAGWAAERAP